MKHFYVSLTEACNLDCAWCFWHQDAERAGDEFDLAAVLQTIGRSLFGADDCGSSGNGSTCTSELTQDISESFIVFYGGEPTLRMERMVEVMDAVEESFPAIKWRFAVQTNGTRLGDVEALGERVWYISLSINEYTIEHIDGDVLERMGRRMPIIARMTYAGKSLVELVEPLLPSISHVYWQLMNAAQLPFTVQQYGEELEQLLELAARHPEKMFVPLDYAWSCGGDGLAGAAQASGGERAARESIAGGGVMGESVMAESVMMESTMGGKALVKAGAGAGCCSGGSGDVTSPGAASASRAADRDWFPCGVGGDLVYIDPRGQTSVCDELSLNGLTGDFAAVVGSVKERCASCELVDACRGRCPAVHMKYGSAAFERYCELTRLLFDTVRKSDHRGRPVDEVGKQTEVMH